MTSDADAITALIYAYAERLDAGDLEGVADLLAQATLRSDGAPGLVHGRDEILSLYQHTVALYGGTPSTKHLTTNVIVEVDDSAATATARSYFTVLQARPELPMQIIISGRYHDGFARVDGQWRFSDRMMYLDLIGDLRFHLKHNPMSG